MDHDKIELRSAGLEPDEEDPVLTARSNAPSSALSSSPSSRSWTRAYSNATIATAAGQEEEDIERERNNLWIPLASWLGGFFCLLFLMVMAWDMQAPSLTAGPFGDSQQLRSGQIAQWERWNVISKSRQATPLRSSAVTPGRLEDGGTSWRRLVLVYQLPGSTIVSTGGLGLAKAVEDKLRSLPAWQQLCTQVPEHLRSLCQRGDSMVSAAYGNAGPVSSEEGSKGVLADIDFDGASESLSVESETLLYLFQEHSPTTLLRWLPTGDPSGKFKGLRSTFAFALPATSAGAPWKSLVDDAEAALLEMGVLSPFAKDQEDFRVYFAADEVPELQDRDLNRSIYQDIWLLLAGPMGCFFAALVLTRRVLVAISAGLLSAVAPSIGSMGLLSSAADPEGHPEIEVVVLTAWFVVAAGIADLSVACVNCLTTRKLEGVRPQVPQAILAGMIYRDKLSPALLDVPTGLGSLVWSILRFATEAMGPTCGVGLMLLNLSVPQLAMVTTFGRHAGTGLLIAMPLSALIIPAAVEAGDQIGLRVKRWDDSRDLEKSEAMNFLQQYFAPVELGAAPLWTKTTQQTFYHTLVEMLQTWWFRYTAPLVIFIIFIAVTAASEPDLLSTYTGSTPQLFADGHRLKEFGSLLADFAALPEPKVPLEDTLRSIRECDLQAHDSEKCNLHKCSTGQIAPESLDEMLAQAPAECRCYTKANANYSATCSGSAARLWGLSKSQARSVLASGTYWNWTHENETMMRGQEAEKPRYVDGSYLEIENWQSMSVFLERGFFSYDGAESWEEACHHNVCFCGQLECSVADDWQSYGSIAYNETAGEDSLVENWIRSTDAAAANISQSLVAEVPAEAADMSYATLTYVFGLSVSDEPVVQGQEDGVRYGKLDLEDVKAQRQLLAFCEGTAPDLSIQNKYCWPLEFKQWLADNNRHYPLLEADGTFYGNLVQYFVEQDNQASVFSASEDQTGFWLGGDGKIAATYFSFEVDEDESGGPAQKDAWLRYASLRNTNASGSLGPAWLAPGENAVAEGQNATAAIVRSGTQSLAGFLVMFPALWVLGMTWSVGLSAATAILLATSVMIVDLFHLRALQQQVGVLEILSLCVLMTFESFMFIRVSQQIAQSQDGPGRDRADKRRKHMHLQKLGHLSVRLGLTIDEEEERQKEEEAKEAQKIWARRWAWCCGGPDPEEDEEWAEDSESEEPEQPEAKPESPTKKLLRNINTKILGKTEAEKEIAKEELTKRTQTAELTFEERKELLKKMSLLNGPGIFPEGIEVERRFRIARGVSEIANSTLAVGLVCVSCWPAGEATALTGIWQVCAGGLVGAAMALFLTFVCLPALLMMGLGPSRVKGRAYAYFYWWMREGRPRPNTEAPPPGLLDTDLGTVGVASAKVLGFPFDRALLMKRHIRVSEPTTGPVGQRPHVVRKYGGKKKRSKAGSYLPEEGEGITINSLDLHGATAPQPYHLALAVRNKFDGTG
mmetsp:Transcript_7235/g.12954  ORF Transcript_7235/g.12954 Transcript_7235/m.12954 type:complete len:1473 (+) Transcript_7235:123-4541(+)